MAVPAYLPPDQPFQGGSLTPRDAPPAVVRKTTLLPLPTLRLTTSGEPYRTSLRNSRSLLRVSRCSGSDQMSFNDTFSLGSPGLLPGSLSISSMAWATLYISFL